MRNVVVYEYDKELRPGLIGADFGSDNKNEEFTLRYEPDEAEKLGRDIAQWILETKTA